MVTQQAIVNEVNQTFASHRAFNKQLTTKAKKLDAALKREMALEKAEGKKKKPSGYQANYLQAAAYAVAATMTENVNVMASQAENLMVKNHQLNEISKEMKAENKEFQNYLKSNPNYDQFEVEGKINEFRTGLVLTSNKSMGVENSENVQAQQVKAESTENSAFGGIGQALIATNAAAGSGKV